VVPYPLCASTGRILKNASHETYDFDSFGLGISNYFKMLKSLSILFLVLYGVQWLGLINVYWSGENSSIATQSYEKILFK